ncbi:NAD-dependent epimerase/dehydratase family protein [Ensifer sp. HO-A22]|uniref:NAD-dependent epimerase/dehydratase family protein n=2 Tax=Ensifer oleiphilus TaxID=2742698 RepID=A0A7Y6UPW1_9HYPH|nr:NAD-dependent epimerase/dehydratase family protein [Ensifer oleiphilus]
MTDRSIAAAAAATDNHVPYRRIFLTGGSGYVGRNLIRHFVGRGIEVVALVRSERSEHVVGLLGAHPYRGDILVGDLTAAMSGCDGFIHAAADTDHGPATNRQRQVNEYGTRAVMEAARAAGIRKVVHLSTESVLATGKPLVNVDETMPMPHKFAGGYSRSKAAAERIALESDAPEFSVVVLRPRFVWGRDDTTALPALIEAVRSGKFAWIGGGTYLTSTTHIANLCVAVERALERGRGGEAYFISDGMPVPFRTFVSSLLETQRLIPTGKSVPRSVVGTIAAIGDLIALVSAGRITMPLTWQSYATSAVEISLDIGKARRELAYSPVISREQGLEELRSGQHW